MHRPQTRPSRAGPRGASAHPVVRKGVKVQAPAQIQPPNPAGALISAPGRTRYVLRTTYDPLAERYGRTANPYAIRIAYDRELADRYGPNCELVRHTYGVLRYDCERFADGEGADEVSGDEAPSPNSDRCAETSENTSPLGPHPTGPSAKRRVQRSPGEWLALRQRKTTPRDPQSSARLCRTKGSMRSSSWSLREIALSEHSPCVLAWYRLNVSCREPSGRRVRRALAPIPHGAIASRQRTSSVCDAAAGRVEGRPLPSQAHRAAATGVLRA
jgi:hypothetical protein